MEERKVGLVPRIVIQGPFGPKDYGLLFTDRRAIFVLELSSKAMIGAAAAVPLLGGIVGGLAAAAVGNLEERKTYCYEKMNPDFLAEMEKSIIVPYAAIRDVKLKKSLGAYRMRMEFLLDSGKVGKIDGTLYPPSELVEAKMNGGMGRKDVFEQYAENVKNLIKLALPPSAIIQVEWDS